MIRLSTRLLVLAASAAALCAQQRVDLPVSGFVFDAGAKALRPVLGVSGAALLGRPIDSDGGLLAAHVAPLQDSAILVTAAGARLVRLRGSSALALACDGLLRKPEAVVFSPSGTAAALYGEGRVQLLSGLPDAPAAEGIVDVLPAPRGPRPAPALAVSDDGRYLLAAVRGSVRLLGVRGENFRVMEAGPSALAAFAPRSHDAAVADPAAAGVVLLQDVAGAGGRRVLAAKSGGAAAASAVAFTADGRKLLLASSASVTAFDAATGEAAAIPLPLAAAGLFPMGGWFRLNEPAAGPLWLLEAQGPEPRVVFVPAPKE